MQCLIFNPSVQITLKAGLCDWRYSHADLLCVEVLLELKLIHCVIFKADCCADESTLLC